jgi:competence protein ComEC
MDLPRLIILDVAHGNCAILQAADEIAIIDCAHGDTLIQAIRELHISYVDRIIISHADEDHIKGFIDLLADEQITVGHIYINPDGSKKTRTWTKLRRLIEYAKINKRTIRHFIHTDMEKPLSVGDVNLEILAPSMDMLGQAGGLDLTEKSLNSNSVSVVIRLVYQSRGIALLAGDIDQVGLDNLLSYWSNIQADVLVFPHHGGHVGLGKKEDNQAFTTLLCQQVKPKLVIFSIGREKHNNPRQEIVETVVKTLPDTHILCTQLSKKCCSPDGLLQVTSNHIIPLPSRGRELNHCCGGTVIIDLSKTQTEYEPNLAHRNFVENHVHTPLCKINS